MFLSVLAVILILPIEKRTKDMIHAVYKKFIPRIEEMAQ